MDDDTIFFHVNNLLFIEVLPPNNVLSYLHNTVGNSYWTFTAVREEHKGHRQGSTHVLSFATSTEIAPYVLQWVTIIDKNNLNVDSLKLLLEEKTKKTVDIVMLRNSLNRSSILHTLHSLSFINCTIGANTFAIG